MRKELKRKSNYKDKKSNNVNTSSLVLSNMLNCIVKKYTGNESRRKKLFKNCVLMVEALKDSFQLKC